MLKYVQVVNGDQNGNGCDQDNEDEFSAPFAIEGLGIVQKHGESIEFNCSLREKKNYFVILAGIEPKVFSML